MARKRSKKKVKRRPSSLDTTIIEQLACLEINNLILQPPFHLVSNIQWNDKGVSFDGGIEVYSHQKIEKSNFVNKVPVQIKGTTKPKTILRNNKIKHLVFKKDIEVFYKQGQGVLFFVVTINPITYVRQAYYRILAPLELISILKQLDISGKDSISLLFKKLEKGYLETLCKIFINEVQKQPKQYIEDAKDKEFIQYKVNIIDIQKDSFNLFEETAYIYGVSSDNTVMPLNAVKIDELRFEENGKIQLNGEETTINYLVTSTEQNYKVIIEKTLTFDLNLKKKTGKLHLGKVRTLGSYVKCLQLMNYYIKHKKLPLPSLQIAAASVKMENLVGIEEEIESYRELIEVCKQIGLSENYVFNDEEDLPSLFNAIISIFKNKKYNLLNFQEEKLENTKIIRIELSKYVKLRLIYVDDKFINFYSEEALKRLVLLTPKHEINKNPELFSENWEEHYQRVSITVGENIEEMVEDANFDFEILKLSFDEQYHDIQANLTIDDSLKYIRYYDKFHDERYLNLALDLNKRYLEKFPEDDIPKVNIFLIKLKKHHELTEDEQSSILDIQERADNDKNQMLSFACEVLLQNKLKAKRIFNLLNDDEKERMINFPIYHLYENLK